MPYSDPVTLGQDMLTIAKEKKLKYTKLVELNEPLIKKKRSVGMLAQGDRVRLPDPEPEKFEKAQVAKSNVHVIEGEPPKALLRLRLLHFGGQEVNGVTGHLSYNANGMNSVQSVTINNGILEHKLDLSVTEAKLALKFPKTDLHPEYTQEYSLKISYLEPLSDNPGEEAEVAARAAQARLNNLAFFCGKVDGIIGKKTRAALKSFQQSKNDPNATGELNADTAKKLRAGHEEK
jgi:N-acetylmuramoyl-L-alanine amidase